MGIIQIGLASTFFAYGIRRISAIQAMLTAMIEPILNPVWVLIVTGEKPSASALAGGSIIVAAVVISSLIGWRRDTA
jgi:drug/metabolite transporter (DMT)-like permease